MWVIGQYFQNVFGNDAGEDLYESLTNDDHSEIVMKLYKKLKRMPLNMTFRKKSYEKSDILRQQGNNAFKFHCYREALICYNRALCYAPNNSRSLKLAYGNRSALLYESKEYKNALKDIETCYQLGCPDDLVQKLKIRMEKCHQSIHNVDVKSFIETLINSKDSLNQKLCSSDEIFHISNVVKLDKSGTHPKIIAAEDINVGTVIALETAFVSTSVSNKNAYLTCYHCMKSSLNLIPCDNCCLVMFCDKTCKTTSLKEYHAVECQLLCKDYIGNVNLWLKAVIKIKNQCNTWDEFIKVASNLYHKKLKPEQFTCHINNFTLFRNETDTRISWGTKANRAIITAELINGLEATGSYFPTAKNEKLQAMLATAKLLMHLFLHSRVTILRQCAESPLIDNKSVLYPTCALFTFLGNFEHSCHPNLIIEGKNDKAVLTALQPIKRGTPLTVSHVEHYIYNSPNREINIYGDLGIVCSCKVCIEKWGKVFMKNYKLSSAQKKYFKENDIKNVSTMCIRYGFKLTYQRICQGLELFTDLPSTMEYIELLGAFIAFQRMVFCAETGNKTLLDK